MARAVRPAVTLVELLIVTAIGGLLVLLVLAAAQTARTVAACANHLHNLGLAYGQRVHLGHEAFQGRAAWVRELLPYTENQRDLFGCPSDANRPVVLSSYGINGRAQDFHAADRPKVLLLDYQALVADAGDDWPTLVAPRHRGGLNVLFTDLSVKPVRSGDIDLQQPSRYQQYWLPSAELP